YHSAETFTPLLLVSLSRYLVILNEMPLSVRSGRCLSVECTQHTVHAQTELLPRKRTLVDSTPVLTVSCNAGAIGKKTSKWQSPSMTISHFQRFRRSAPNF